MHDGSNRSENKAENQPPVLSVPALSDRLPGGLGLRGDLLLDSEGVLRNRGVLYGPWLPIYGVGALGIYAAKPLKNHPVWLFFLCAAVAGVVEYSIGSIGLRLFGVRLWDYWGLLWNIDGIICLRSVASFALMGLVFHYRLEPAAERLFQKLRPNTVRAACLMLLLAMLFDCILSAFFRTPILY